MQLMDSLRGDPPPWLLLVLPRPPFSFFPFGPGTHASLENYLASVRFDGNVIGIDFGAASEGLLDSLLDLDRFCSGSQPDQVGHAFDAPDITHRGFSDVALVMPLDCALQRDPPVFHHDLDSLRRDRQLTPEGG